jgi:hypothetical protein
VNGVSHVKYWPAQVESQKEEEAEELSQYELERRDNMAENKSKLSDLGLA